jgi:hypothetical protein
VQLLPKKEAQLSGFVADYVKRKFKCRVTRELKLPGCIFDVVGFNPETEDFYLVETKLGSKPAQIGHAFGQMLAYEAVISQDGYEFMARLFDKLNSGQERLTFDTMSRMRESQTVNIYRYAALTDEACRNYQLIRDLKGRMSAPVGVIRYDGRCRNFLISDSGAKDYDICKSEPVTIGIAKRYPDREEFFDEVSRRLLRLYPHLTVSKHPHKKPRYVQWRLGHSGFHLEAHATRKEVSVSLDIEFGSKRRTAAFFKAARASLRRLRRKVEGLKVEQRWANKGRWGRVAVHVEHPAYDEHLVERAVDALSKMYLALRDDIEMFA